MTVTRFLVVVYLLAFACTKVAAQSGDAFDKFVKGKNQQYDTYIAEKQKEYEEARRKRNAEYAKLLARPWIQIKPELDIPKPKDEPLPPVIIKPKTEPELIPKILPFDEVVPAPIVLPQPQPITPIQRVPEPKPMPTVEPRQTFCFYGTTDNVRFDKKHTIRLASLKEATISNAWNSLSEDKYTDLIHDCLQIRKNRNLCDWAYLNMLQQMSESICGKGTNESVLLMAYVYCQSGYKMRLAIGNDNKLYMLFASKHDIYGWLHFKIDNMNYYAYGNKKCDVRICKATYPNEQPMSLLVTQNQDFDISLTKTSSYKSKSDADMHVELKANQNMLDFYTDYPSSCIGGNFMTRWAMYANTPMPLHIRKQIYPKLSAAIANCSKLDAVKKILNMVQTGFLYEFDDKVWGCDRAFFPEESLHYQYCDCEDRAILITRLVRDLLGLECILVYYPGHLAAAVCITDGNPTGDYIELDGKRYFLADGAILYATPLGKTMRNMDNKTAKVILLD